MLMGCLTGNPIVVPQYGNPYVFEIPYSQQKWNYEQDQLLRMQMSRRLLELQLDDDYQWNSDTFEQ